MESTRLQATRSAIGSPEAGAPCPLCASRTFAPHRFGLVRCAACGLVVDRRIFAPDLDRELNEEAFGESWNPERSFWVRWFETWKNRRYLATIRRFAKGARLLEVGVGSGRFLEAGRAAGFEVEGCDLSEAVCRHVEQRIGVPVRRSSLADLPKASSDVVAMHHVLEHVEDPVGFLRAARELLRPGGIIHVAVPNAACKGVMGAIFIQDKEIAHGL